MKHTTLQAILTHKDSVHVLLPLPKSLDMAYCKDVDYNRSAATTFIHFQTIKTLSALGSLPNDGGLFYLTNHDLLLETLPYEPGRSLSHKSLSQTN